MLKLTIIVAAAIVSMAFVPSGKSNELTSVINNNLMSFASPDQGGKGNKGGGGNHGSQGGQAKQGGGNHGGNANPIKHKSPGAPGKGMMKQNQKNHLPKSNQFKDHGKGGNSHNSNHSSNGNHSNGKGNKGAKGHFGKGHPNFGYAYVNNHGYISHSNYGQWRSQQAKNKHKKYHPVYEYEAVEGFNFIIGRNVFLFSETEYKMNLYTVRLEERRDAGKISAVEYDNSMNRIAVLEQRRSALQININL